MQQKREFLVDALHIFILFSFAFAQPLFDLLSRNAGFFVARHSRPIDVILLVLILCVLLPVLIVLIEVVTGLFGRRVRKGVHYFMVTGLIAVIALPALKKILEIPGTALLVGVIILGIVVTITYIRFHPVRMFLTVLSPALLIFPGLFLFNSPVTKIVFPAKDPSAVEVKIDNPPPIIMVIFDEFPVTSLMDERRMIDSIRYPNFAALTQDSYWFRNASTVSGASLVAIPAVLSGSYPGDPSKIPIALEYPHNLFTLLGNSYEMKVFESHTMLCPKTLCQKSLQNVTQRMFSLRQKSLQNVTQRMFSLLSDLSFVFLHIVLPSELTGGLPIVTQTWKGFGVKTVAAAAQAPNMKGVLDDRVRASYKDRSGLFRKFVRSIAVTDKPTLHFLHIILPHIPWEYLPSGKVYTEKGMEIPGLDIKREQWDDNEWLVIQGYQRHLLQVGFVDELLGNLLDKLKSLDLYDKSLIVITADHGVNFWPNKSRRGKLEKHPMGILGVPLFIKVPYQHVGIISDHKVKTIDILPTIADILDVHLPWRVDGHSALDLSLPERKKKVIFFKNAKKQLVVDSAALEAKYKTLKRKLALFGSGTTKPDGLFKIGPNSELIGRHVSEVELMGNDEVMIQLDQALLFANVDPKASFVPAHITGRLLKSEGKGDPLNLAVAVNGTIQAVTQTFDNKEGNAKFSAIVPETSFQKGRNDVEVFVVSRGDGQLQLARTKSRSTVTYSLAESSGQSSEIITSSDGKFMPVIPNALKGHLDVVDVRSEYVVFAGWAADVTNSQLPEAIVIFVNGKFFYSGLCNADRPDVAKVFENTTLQEAGFRYMFPLSMFKNITPSEARIFAVSKKGVATELNYPIGYKWGRKS